jgi:hypothetical protein
MSGAAACAAAAAAAVDEKAAAALTVSQVMQTLAMQPSDVLAEAKKEIDILGNIKALKEQQKNLRDERLKVGKQLRNEEKRRMRLRKRARQLSDGDLVALLKMRSAGKADSASVPAEDPSAEAA